MARQTAPRVASGRDGAQRQGRTTRPARQTTLASLFAFGAAAIIRNTAGTITAMLGLLFVLPVLVGRLPRSWQNDLVR